MDLLLGIDLGTGSTKGVLVDTSGVVLASETIAHSMELPRPGWAEVDAEELWWREVCSISAALTAQASAGLSDLQFTGSYRVPYQYSPYLRKHLKTGSFLQSSSGVTVTDLDGNVFADSNCHVNTNASHRVLYVYGSR